MIDPIILIEVIDNIVLLFMAIRNCIEKQKIDEKKKDIDDWQKYRKLNLFIPFFNFCSLWIIIIYNDEKSLHPRRKKTIRNKNGFKKINETIIKISLKKLKIS